jgi:hypothetical protein
MEEGGEVEPEPTSVPVTAPPRGQPPRRDGTGAAEFRRGTPRPFRPCSPGVKPASPEGGTLARGTRDAEWNFHSGLSLLEGGPRRYPGGAHGRTRGAEWSVHSEFHSPAGTCAAPCMQTAAKERPERNGTSIPWPPLPPGGTAHARTGPCAGTKWNGTSIPVPSCVRMRAREAPRPWRGGRRAPPPRWRSPQQSAGQGRGRWAPPSDLGGQSTTPPVQVHASRLDSRGPKLRPSAAPLQAATVTPTASRAAGPPPEGAPCVG